MTYDEYVSFIELLNVDITELTNEIAKLEAELADEQAKEEQDSDKIAEIEANLASLLENK